MKFISCSSMTDLSWLQQSSMLAYFKWKCWHTFLPLKSWPPSFYSAPSIVHLHTLNLYLFFLLSSSAGPTDNEGEPGGCRRELCRTRSEDEEALQINSGRVWTGPGECRTWTKKQQQRVGQRGTEGWFGGLALSSLAIPLWLSSSPLPFFTKWNV